MFGSFRMGRLRKKLIHSLDGDAFQRRDFRPWLEGARSQSELQAADEPGWLVHLAYHMGIKQDPMVDAVHEVAMTLAAELEPAPLLPEDIATLDAWRTTTRDALYRCYARVESRSMDMAKSGQALDIEVDWLDAFELGRLRTYQHAVNHFYIGEEEPAAFVARLHKVLAERFGGVDEEALRDELGEDIEDFDLVMAILDRPEMLDLLDEERPSEAGYRTAADPEHDPYVALYNAVELGLVDGAVPLARDIPPAVCAAYSCAVIALIVRERGHREALFVAAGRALALLAEEAPKRRPYVCDVLRRHFGWN